KKYSHIGALKEYNDEGDDMPDGNGTSKKGVEYLMGPGGQRGAVVNDSYVHPVAFVLLLAEDQVLQLRNSKTGIQDEQGDIQEEQQYEEPNQSIRVINAEITNQIEEVKIWQKNRGVNAKFKGNLLFFNGVP